MNGTARLAGAPARGQKWKLVRAYTYEFVDGKELFQHVRWLKPDGNKTFTYRWRPTMLAPWKNEKPELAKGGNCEADHYLWKLPELLNAKRWGKTIAWSEGEKDAEALIGRGVVATTHHGAANGVHVEQCELLHGAKKVVLLMDNDAPGAHCALLRYEGLLDHAGLRPGQVRVLRAAEGKDAADHLAAGLKLRDFIRVSPAELRERASEYNERSATLAGYAYVGTSMGSEL